MAAPPGPEDIDGEPPPAWIGYLILAMFVVGLIVVFLFT